MTLFALVIVVTKSILIHLDNNRKNDGQYWFRLS